MLFQPCGEQQHGGERRSAEVCSLLTKITSLCPLPGGAGDRPAQALSCAIAWRTNSSGGKSPRRDRSPHKTSLVIL